MLVVRFLLPVQLGETQWNSTKLSNFATPTPVTSHAGQDSGRRSQIVGLFAPVRRKHRERCKSKARVDLGGHAMLIVHEKRRGIGRQGEQGRTDRYDRSRFSASIILAKIRRALTAASS